MPTEADWSVRVSGAIVFTGPEQLARAQYQTRLTRMQDGLISLLDPCGLPRAAAAFVDVGRGGYDWPHGTFGTITAVEYAGPTEAEIEAAARVIDADYWEQVDCPLARVGQPNIHEWPGVKESLAKARAALEAAERVRASASSPEAAQPSDQSSPRVSRSAPR